MFGWVGGLVGGWVAGWGEDHFKGLSQFTTGILGPLVPKPQREGELSCLGGGGRQGPTRQPKKAEESSAQGDDDKKGQTTL